MSDLRLCNPRPRHTRPPSARCREWVRPLVKVSAVSGIVALVLALIFRPPLHNSTSPATDGEARVETGAPLAIRALPVRGRPTEQVTNIHSESVAQAIDNLADFDDNQFAMTVSADGFTYGDPADEMLRIVHLVRVRRLLEEGHRSPRTLVPLLRETLQQAIANWPAARAAR